MEVTSYGQSDIGRVRERNEDACLLQGTRSVFAVADGLGGLPEGQLASTTALSILERELDKRGIPRDWKPLFHKLNAEIVVLGRRLSPETGIGTTLTSAALRGDRLEITHVGDSALYRFRPEGMEKLTTDHTLEEEIRSRPDYNPLIPIPRRHSHVLTRCLGQIEDLEIDTRVETAVPGDRFILCTDGITLAITPEEIHPRVLAAASPEAVVRELIALANERGGRDNATAVAIFVD